MKDSASPSHDAPASLEVLLVDDSPEEARLFAEYLEESRVGATLRREAGLDAGLAALREGTPDVLVVDLGLPDGEGPATVRAVARRAPSVPIVVLTGDDDLRAALEMQKAGAAEYLTKGELTPGLVARTLRWAIERSEMHAKLRQRDAWIRSITENIAGGVFRAGPTGRLQYANEALARMLGFEEDEELIGRDLTAFYADPAQRGRMLATEEVDGAEITFERPDGSTFVGLLSAETAYRKGGGVLHYDGVIVDITDRKEAEEQLRRREEQLRRINENISDGIYRSAPGEGLVYANQAFAEMFGYDRVEEVLDADPTTLYADPEQREQLRATLHEEGHFESVEVEFRRKDGTTFTGLLSGTVARGEDGEVEYYDGAVTDVSDRVRRERKLRLLSEAVDQANEAVLITEAEPLDAPGPNIVYVNRAFEEMTGYTEEEVLGETPRMLQGPETDREVLRSLREALEAGESWQGETVNYRKDGAPYRVQWNVAPVRNGAGEIEHWVSVQRDVTAEREREQRMTQMAQALEQVDEKVFITDREGRIQYVNEAFVEITGYPEDEIVGKTPAVLQSGEQDEAFYEDLWDTILSGETFRAEFVNEKKDGTRYVEDESISPVTNEEGEITHFVSAGRDVTERKEREEALRRHRNLLQQAQRLAGGWEVDLRSGDVSWSEEVYRIHEVEPDAEIDLEDGVEFFAPEVRSKIRAALERCVEEGEAYDLELPLDTAEGNRRWVRTVGAPSETENGEVIKVAGAIQDVTDRKQAEQALKESEELHRATLSNITDAVLLTREDGTFSYVCPNVSYIFGYDEDEVEELGSISALLGTDPAEEHEFEGAREISNVEQSIIDASGNPHDLLINIRQVEIQDGRRMYTCRDITERKQAKEALREREAQLRGLANSIPGVVYQFYSRPDGTYGNHFISERAESLLGISSEAEDFFERFIERIPPSHREAFRASVDEAVEREVPWRREIPFDTPSGERIWLLGTSTPQRRDGELLFNGVLLDITQRKEAELELERQNDLFAKAQDLANVGGWEYDVPADEHTWTDQVYRIYGRPDSFDPTVQEGIAHYHPDDRPIIREVFTRAVEEGEPYDVELRLIDGDGHQRWVRTRGVPQRVHGEVVRVRGSIQDITDRKERERRLEAIFNHTYQFTGLMTPDGTVIEANDTALTFGGVTEEEVLGRPIWDLDWIQGKGDSEARLQGAVQRAAEGEFVRYEVEVQGAEDSRIIDFSIRPVTNEEGDVVLLIPEGRDITGRKQKEQELVHQKALLEAQAEATIDGLLAVDADRNVAFYNEQFLDIWAVPTEAVEQDPLGKPLDHLLLDYVTDLLQDPEGFREKVEYLYDHPDEESRDSVQLTDGRWLDRYSAPIVGDDGTHFGRLWVFRDVTERWEREVRLREAKEKAEEASRLKSAMLANMSHEIRTPLTSITGFAELLTDELEGKSATFSERIYESGRRLMKTLDSVLELSKLEAGAYELPPETVRLDRVAEDAVALLGRQAEDKNIDLEVSGGQAVEGHWNEGALNRIAENLIENAIKFTPEGGRVTVRVGETEGEAYLAVEDTGVGISEEALPEIFEAFKQESEGLGREYEGTGLGLSIVKELTDRLGGEIEVESEKGEGTRVTVRLPSAKQSG